MGILKAVVHDVYPKLEDGSIQELLWDFNKQKFQLNADYECTSTGSC